MRLDARELDTRMHSCGPACGRECWVDSLRIRPAWCAHSPIGLEVLGRFVESEEDSPRCLESVHEESRRETRNGVRFVHDDRYAQQPCSDARGHGHVAACSHDDARPQAHQKQKAHEDTRGLNGEPPRIPQAHQRSVHRCARCRVHAIAVAPDDRTLHPIAAAHESHIRHPPPPELLRDRQRGVHVPSRAPASE